MSGGSLLQTPFDAMHRAAGAKMGAFAGYDMPIQYQAGVMKEHLHTRTAAGLFDVSHMGQAILRTKTEAIGTPDAHQAVSAALETLAPAEYQRLKRGRLRYSVLLNDAGGIMDDFITTRFPSQESDGELFLVVNAGCKQNDFSHIADKLGDQASLEVLSDRVLLALQGPEAARVIGDIFPDADKQPFMSMSTAGWRGAEVYVSRCGYTGEDGFEVSLPASVGNEFAEHLLSDTKVEWIGLGARDSLRLEAGLCLYGHDLSPETSPVEGAIEFSIGKRRREEGGFPGADRVLAELTSGAKTRRVGILPDGRAPVREGAVIHDASDTAIGVVTSGGFGPSMERPVAMGYVSASHAEIGREIKVIVRGKSLPAKVVDMPFVPHQYFRG